MFGGVNNSRGVDRIGEMECLSTHCRGSCSGSLTPFGNCRWIGLTFAPGFSLIDLLGGFPFFFLFFESWLVLVVGPIEELDFF